MRVYTDGNVVDGMRKAERLARVVYAKQMDSRFYILHHGEPLEGRAGDYLVRNGKGRVEIVSKEVFEESYRFLE